MQAISLSGVHSAAPTRRVYVGGKLVTQVPAADKPASKAVQACNTEYRANTKRAATAIRIECPHCGWASVVRSSRPVTKLTREYAYSCTNYECGHTFVAHMEIKHTVSPSATPDPSVNLPMSTHVRRDLLRVQMDHARPAEHCTENTAPVTGDLFQSGGAPSD
ncbi:ogr/Delta-like zinc finger family protein [Comamonas terrigena]|uniref:ogr/Delta-like zinc finger family protein n=1 Tax=Comamonas terrigena TaxID=32013 RepID=UPI0023541349|nr:ogr/Delta-like zinc finger family protein [Comamonas terrigena]